jgi:hypothetical protein
MEQPTRSVKGMWKYRAVQKTNKENIEDNGGMP